MFVMKKGETSLSFILKDRLDLSMRFISKGVNVNIKNNPLIWACKTKNLDLVEFLLQHGANSNYHVYNVTPLNTAILYYDYQIIELLLKNGADPNTQDENGDCPIINACLNRSYKVVKLLLSYNANPNVCNKDGNYPLLICLKNNDQL